MSLTEYPLAEILALEDGRTVEREAVGNRLPLMWVERGLAGLEPPCAD